MKMQYDVPELRCSRSVAAAPPQLLMMLPVAADAPPTSLPTSWFAAVPDR
jgi:hypothetical protein